MAPGAAMRISRALRMLSRTHMRIRRMHVTLIFTGPKPGVHERFHAGMDAPASISSAA